MSNGNNENNRDNDSIDYRELIRKNEEARQNAPIVNNSAIWQNPTNNWTEFEIVEIEGTEANSIESNASKMGFTSGKISPNGKMLDIVYPDGDSTAITVNPRSFDKDYENAVKEKLFLLLLEHERRARNDPQYSARLAKSDPAFEATHKLTIQRGKSFLARNLAPLRINVEAGKIVASGGGGKPPKRHKRLTVGGNPNRDKEPGSEDTQNFLLRNFGVYNESIRFDKDLLKLVSEPTSPAIVRRITERGTPVYLVGIVETSADEPVQRIQESKWRCRACGYEIHQHMWSYLEKPSEPSSCPDCQQEDAFEENHVLFNSMLVKIQPDLVQTDSEEAVSGRVWVLLKGNDQTKINPVGLKMIIQGHTDRMPIKNGIGYEPVVIVHKAQHEEKKLIIPEWDEKCIRRFAGVEPLGNGTYLHRETVIEEKEYTVNGETRKRAFYKAGAVERLSRMVAPYLVLDYNQQLAGLLIATGAPEWEGHRGRIPALFIGPPGTVKTLFGEWLLRLRPTSRKADATNMTGLSATAMVLPDTDGNFNIHFGPFIMARHGICMIDEYEKAKNDERNKLLSGTESGYVWIDKYIYHRKIASPTTLLATANPRENKWKDPEAKSISSEEITIELQQLNRFDIILVFTDIRNLELDRAYAKAKSKKEKLERNRTREGREAPDQFIVDFISKYIEYTRSKFKVIETDPLADDLMQEYWSQARQREDDILQRRNLQGIKRIAEAIARLEQSNTVNETIARQAMQFHNQTIDPFIKGIIIVRTPEDELFYQVVDHIRKRNGQPVMVREVVRIKASADKRLNDYITGADKNKNYPLEQDKNYAYDKLCTALKDHPYIEVVTHKTKNAKLHAFTVRWNVEKYSEDEKLKKQKAKDESSSTIHQSSGTQMSPPQSENDYSKPDLSIESSEASLHSSQNQNQILAQSYGKQGFENSEINRGGEIQSPDDRCIIIEDNSETPKTDIVIVKDKFETAVDMLRKSAVSVDFECNQAKNNQIFQASFKDHTGRSWALNLADKEFNRDEAKLLKAIIGTLKNYRMVLGYFTQWENSDWEVLDSRCKAYGIESPINVYVPKQQEPNEEQRKFIGLRLKGSHGYDIIDIDIGMLHKKPTVKGFFATQRIIYNSNDLDTVAKVRLGRGKFTVGGKVSGDNVASQSAALQKAYGIGDAELCFDLATKNNNVLIATMQAIADKAKLSFQVVCNSGPSKWWTSYYENVMGVKSPAPQRVPPKKGQKKYKGGMILDYKRGEYFNVSVFDFNQLYPNVAIESNVSPETVFQVDDPKYSCGHEECKTEGLIATNDRNINKKKYYTCRKIKGKYPQAVEALTADRKRFQDLERHARDIEKNEEKAIEYGLQSGSLKVFANSGYGVFGNPYFKFSDLRTAEIITAISRTKLAGLSALAEQHGYTPRYGDTDSVFLEGPTSKEQLEAFERACKEKLGVPAKYELTFIKLLLVSAKNYVGVYMDKDGIKKPMVKGLVGKKSGTAKWAKKTFDQIIKCWLNDEKEGMYAAIVDAVSNLKNGDVPEEDLLIATKCGQDPFKGYNGKGQQNLPQCVIGQAEHTKEGEAVRYFLSSSDVSEFGTYYTKNFARMSIEEYLHRLETTVLRVMNTAGFPVEDIYEALELKIPSPANLRDKLQGKPKKKEADADEADDIDAEELEEEEEEEYDDE